MKKSCLEIPHEKTNLEFWLELRYMVARDDMNYALVPLGIYGFAAVLKAHKTFNLHILPILHKLCNYIS